MRPQIPLFILGIIAWLAFGTYAISNWFCTGAATGTAATTFSVQDGDFTTNKVASFSFLTNGSAVQQMDASTESALQKIATYLSNNPERTLNLTGYHSTMEKNSTDFENLGLARAAALKAKLVEMGAVGENITTSSMESAIERQNNETIYGGVDFLFGGGGNNSDTSGDSNDSDAGSGALSLESGYVFQYDRTDITSDYIETLITDEIKQFADMAMNYITANEGAKLMITAHTDNSESSSANEKLSKVVATKVRRYFRNNGFSTSQVEWRAMGDTDPVASNADDLGKTENRRVVLTVE